MIDALILSVTEGCGIRDLQEIWPDCRAISTICIIRFGLGGRRTLEKRGAMLLRLSATGFWPISWQEAWLADEYTARPFDVSQERVFKEESRF